MSCEECIRLRQAIEAEIEVYEKATVHNKPEYGVVAMRLKGILRGEHLAVHANRTEPRVWQCPACGSEACTGRQCGSCGERPCNHQPGCQEVK